MMMIIDIRYDVQANVYVATDPVYGIMSQGTTKEEAAMALDDAVESFLIVAARHGYDPFDICPSNKTRRSNA